ncbi:MAG: right-handed parallel beta-helix repeat-containing protein [Methanospirillum sp.]|nr:right-handed parallel beta-helix repeat-containing protein [Methanospirillum sp.]
MRTRTAILLMIGLCLLLVPLHAAAAGPTVIVAASDASTASKAQAQILCKGFKDDQQINEAFNRLPPEGGTIQLTEGTFQIENWIHPKLNSNFYGAGQERTVINAYNPSRYANPIHLTRPNVHVKGFTLRGMSFFKIRTNGVVIEDVTVTSVDINGVRQPTDGNGMFFIWVDNPETGDITFRNCTAIDANTHGFNMNADRNASSDSWTIRNLRFIDCQAIRCGFGVDAGSNSEFSCGFDIQEANNLENVYMINCLAEDNWENGFHFEPGWYLGTKNVYMEKCVARNNGQRKPAEAPFRDSYLSGWYVHRNSQLKNCVSINNKNAGFFAHDGVNTTFDNCIDIGSTYGFKIVKGCKDITLRDCWSQDAKEWAFWGAFGDNIRVENFHQMNMGGKAVDGGAPTQSNIGWYYHDPQYHHSVSNSYFDITGYGPSIDIMNRYGNGNTYIYNRATSQYPIPAHHDIAPKSIPPLPIAGGGGFTPPVMTPTTPGVVTGGTYADAKAFYAAGGTAWSRAWEASEISTIRRYLGEAKSAYTSCLNTANAVNDPANGANLALLKSISTAYVGLADAALAMYDGADVYAAGRSQMTGGSFGEAASSFQSAAERFAGSKTDFTRATATLQSVTYAGTEYGDGTAYTSAIVPILNGKASYMGEFSAYAQGWQHTALAYQASAGGDRSGFQTERQQAMNLFAGLRSSAAFGADATANYNVLAGLSG